MAVWRNGTSVNRSPAELELAAYTTDSGAALPGLPQALVYPAGALFCRTTDSTIWRSTGAAWVQLAGAPQDPAMGGDLTGTASAAQIAAGAILNADVNNAAGITYGKLALTGGIVNADVNAAAAIDKTKLALPTPYGFSNDRSGVIASGSAPGVNQVRLMRYTVEETRTYTSMLVYLTAVAAGNMVGGIYDTSATNLAVLGSSASVAIGSLNTWQQIDFTSGVPLTIGQDIFVAIHTDNSTVAFGRSAVASNTAVSGPLPAGFIRGGDASGFNWCNFNRGSYSAPLASIPVASLTSNAGGFIFWLK